MVFIPGGIRSWRRRSESLSPGTVLDGELVRLSDQGTADFPALLRRHQLTSARKIRWAVRRAPVTYVVFDLLRLDGRSLLQEPLRERRALLERLVASLPSPRLASVARRDRPRPDLL